MGRGAARGGRAVIPPGLAHAAIGAAISAAVAVPAQLFGVSAGIGAAVAIGFYAGRERRQAEEWWGSNRIPPWRWKPRALRDVAWPALSALVAAYAVGVVL